MRTVSILTGRNLRLFFRDRAGVFFSLLSALILIGAVCALPRESAGRQSDGALSNAETGDIHWFVNAWCSPGSP